MLVWRLTKPDHAPGLDGEGARLWGGRWNSPGVQMVYCATSLALAALEVLVHLPAAMRRAGALPVLVAVCLDVPDDQIGPLELNLLHDDQDACRAWGNQWIASQSELAVVVQSMVIKQERNVLLNPTHPRMVDVQLIVQEPFRFDDRLQG